MSDEPEKSIDELTAEFHTLMGHAIANWAKIEAHLFKIFRAALGASARRSAIVFSRAGQLESRRQLVDAILATRFPPRPKNGGIEHDDARQWRCITSDMRSLISIRNMIAHQPMEPHIDWDDKLDGGVGRAELWYEITASDHQRARDGAHGDSLDADDLKKHIDDVLQLYERIRTFYADTLPKHARLLP